MHRFNWLGNPSKEDVGLLRDDKSADIATATTSPHSGADHTSEEALLDENLVDSPESPTMSTNHPNFISHAKRLGEPGFGISLQTSSEHAAQNSHNATSVNNPPVSAATPTSEVPLLSAHSPLPVVENGPEYHEDETPQDFVERRLGRSSNLSLVSELGQSDGYTSCRPKLCGPESCRPESRRPNSRRSNSRQPESSRPLTDYERSRRTMTNYEVLSRDPSGKVRMNAMLNEHGVFFVALISAVYAFLWSLYWLFLALGSTAKLNWKEIISSDGHSLTTVVTAISLNSKLIEVLSLGNYGLAVGQIVSREAISPGSRGMDLSATNIRLWITRPGTFVTRFAAVKCAMRMWPTLSILSVVTAIAGFSYTSASNALVSPKLGTASPESEVLFGLVQSSYANPTFVQQTCRTPITQADDNEFGSSTCLAMEHVGQAYANYLGYTQTWAQIVGNNSGQARDLSQRPLVTAQLSGNTSVQGSWIETEYTNMTLLHGQYERVINNVTVAMPHSGVISAASDRKNSVFQPEHVGIADQYSLRAAVPSPALNVLCVNVDLDEIAPLVYTQWPHAKTKSMDDIPGWRLPNSTLWQGDIPTYSDHEWLNATVVDDIFGWGPKYNRTPPVFSALPIDYNSVTNTSAGFGDSIYVLIKPNGTSQYTVCSMRVFLYPNCATEYAVAGPFATLQSQCDPDEAFAYKNFVTDAPITFSHDWPNIANLWALTLSLNDGAIAGNASNARQLSELVTHGPSLDPVLPSAAEALAVLAGNTLLLSMIGSPFVHYWQYNATILNPGIYESFNASIVTQQYFSRATSPWENIFMFSLFWILFVNLGVIIFLVYTKHIVTDYTETENIFALGVAAPTNDILVDYCAHDHELGPKDRLLGVPFRVVKKERGYSHFTGHFTGSSREASKKLKRMAENGDIELGLMRRRTTQNSRISQLVEDRNKNDGEPGPMSRRTTQTTLSEGVVKEEEFV